MNRYIYIASICAATLLTACGRQQESAREPAIPPDAPDMRATGEPAPARPDQLSQAASVQLQPTAGSRTYGSLQVAAQPGAVRLSGTVQGLQPDSEFGFHIHEKGDCSAPDALSAGGHFNPNAAPHGNPEAEPRHAGDMLNIKSDAAGVAKVDITVNGVSLQDGGATDVLGKGVVVHAQPDDYRSQPAGNSGGRIACGVIAVQAPTDVPTPAVSGGTP